MSDVLKLNINVLDGPDISCSMKNTDTVLDLKMMIREMLDYSIKEQRLIFCGKIMIDTDVLSKYNIKIATTIHLIINDMLKLHIITLSGEKMMIVLDCKATILDLKKCIRTEWDISISRQALVFSGKQMDDDSLIIDNGVSKETTIHLIIMDSKRDKIDEIFIKMETMIRNLLKERDELLKENALLRIK